MQNISELDSKILKILLKDGRTGFCEIAKQCGVSKNKAWKRCRAMENRGIINGATVQLNFGVFGYEALVTLLISVDAQQIEQAMELIGNITEVNARRQYTSVYNIRAVASLKNLSELDYVKQLIKRKLPILGLKTYIWTGVRNIPENLNIVGDRKDSGEKNQTKTTDPTFVQGKKIVVDDLDRQLAAKLTLNGRTSFTKIAHEMQLSTDTIVKRYHRLRESGAIKVLIQINPYKIGYTSIIDFNVAFTTIGGSPNQVVESLAKIPDVILVTLTSGDYDLQVSAMTRDMEQTFAVQDQIAKICGVTRIEASTRKIPDKWPMQQQCISTL